MHTKKPAIVALFIIITLDAMGIGLIAPIMPDLLIEVGNTSLTNSALWGGILMSSFAFMQFLFGPLIGNISDRFGRRPVLLISLFFMGIDYIVMAFAETIWLLFVTRIIGGITAATYATAFAAVADISDAEEKPANFGLISAAFGLGFVLGPIIGGLLGSLGTRAPFLAATMLVFIGVCITFFTFKESLPEEERRRFSFKRANPIGALYQLKKKRSIILLAYIFFFTELAFYAYPTIWSYFCKAQFNWSTGMIGLSLSIYGTALFIVQAGLVHPIVKKFGTIRTVIFALTLSVFNFIFLGFVKSALLLLISIPFLALATLLTPALESILSDMTGRDEQGELQGILSEITALSTLISPFLMTQIFAFSTHANRSFYAPGAPFILSSALVALALLIFLIFAQKHGKNHHKTLKAQ